MKYEAEIDGLRALAVLSVLFFSPGFRWLWWRVRRRRRFLRDQRLSHYTSHPG